MRSLSSGRFMRELFDVIEQKKQVTNVIGQEDGVEPEATLKSVAELGHPDLCIE